MPGVGILNSYVTTSNLDDNLTAVRVVLDDGKRSVPSTPVVFGGRRSVVIYKISFPVVVLASD